MVLVLKKGATLKEIEAIEKKLYTDSEKAGFDAKKYNGKIPMGEDAMKIQTRLRNEWERDIS